MAGTIEVNRYATSRLARPLGKPTTAAVAINRAITLSRTTGGPFHLRYRSDDKWGPKRTLRDLRPHVTARVAKLTLGDALWIDNRGDQKAIVRIRKVLISTDPLDLSNCTEQCEVIIADLRQAFPNHLNLGWFNCRRILGSSEWSQHAFGNAYDAGGPFAMLQAIATHVVAGAQQGRLPVAQVIFNRKVWEPDTGWRSYSGSDPHTGHVHITARPELFGTPPCAR